MNKKNKSKSSQQQRFLKDLSISFGFGFSIAIPIVGGGVLGFMIDNKFNSNPKMTLSLLFAGIFIAAGAIYQVIKESKKE